MKYSQAVSLTLMGVIAMAVGLADRGDAPKADAGAGTVVATLFIVALILHWYRRDAQARGYGTTWGMTTAMALLTVIALPWYLVRSRAGIPTRAKALTGLATSFFLVMGCYYVGAGS